MRILPVDVEQRTQEIGRELFRRARDAQIPFSLNRWLDERFVTVARLGPTSTPRPSAWWQVEQTLKKTSRPRSRFPTNWRAGR